MKAHQIFAFLAVLFTCAFASVQIDDLTVFSNTVRSESVSITPEDLTDMNTPQTNAASFLGTRQITTFLQQGDQGDGLSAVITGGSMQCNTNSGSFGTCTFDYTGIGGLDFLACGCSCLGIVETEPDRDHELVVTFTSGGTTAVSTHMGQPFSGSRQICIPFSAPFDAYRNVDQIEFVVDATIESQLDVNIIQFCCLPATLAWHTFDRPGPYFTDECVDVTVNMNNPVRDPPTAETLSYSFPLNSMGEVSTGSISCSGGISGVADANGLSGSGTIASGGTGSCSFEVCWTAAGSGDFWAIINNPTIGNAYNSNAEDSRLSDPDAQCQPPSPTSIVTQLPPSTLPPTTLPPTTLPPTTLPPTTAPPTTLPPTTLPPTTEPPTTLPPTSLPPTTLPPTTLPPTTLPPTTLPPTTEPPTTLPPTSLPPTTLPPITLPPTTEPPTTEPPTTLPPTTAPPTTLPPTTLPPTTLPPTTLPPTTLPPTTLPPTTLPPTTLPPTTLPPTTLPPTTLPPTTEAPTPPRDVCIWANIVNGQCMCKSWNCECTGEGIDKMCVCPTDEWYCIYVDPLQQDDDLFDVFYCTEGIKQKCVCDLFGNVVSGPTVVSDH